MSNKDFVERLFKVLSESAENNPEISDKIIEENKIDLVRLGTKVERHLKRIRMEEQLGTIQALKDKIVELKKAYVRKHDGESSAQLFNSLKDVLQVSDDNAAFAAFFREFKSLDESDMNKILTEAEILKIIEEELKSQE